MTPKEKADLLNGILTHLKDNGLSGDLSGFGQGLKNPDIVRALKGLEKNGYVKLVIPEDSGAIFLVTITELGVNVINNGGFTG